jgi:hypothetical protein
VTRRTTVLLSAFLTLLAQPAAASEKYICHLDRFMEVANDGRFFGPETTQIRLEISVEDERVLYKLDGIESELALIEKLGTAQFAAKGDLAAMTTLHVWRQGSAERYDVQYSTNYANSITIRTGICLR